MDDQIGELFGGRVPATGVGGRLALDAEGIAEITELQALFLKRMEQRRDEGDDSPETQLEWEGVVQPDFAGMSNDERESIEARIKEIRADPAFRARLKRRLEQENPDLAPLMDLDG